ncbi:MAG: sugar O-acetyltransferase [Lentisphaerae bacterium]|jgi:maltose O-acetyltransferase|nr:sugar O-acetyltransferase [Lentisphaerota bacterium]
MKEEDNLLAGVLFRPGHPELRAIKLRSHKLSAQYSRTDEDDVEIRQKLLELILNEFGEGSFIQGPVFFHYGKHTTIGHNNFFNYNLTIQDDALVTIGNHNSFGPNFTIVTPVHPLLPGERKLMHDKDGNPARLCYAKPVVIGNDCWFGANVTVCPGVTIGDACVIGAGSVVTRNIPSHTVAAGVPCKVIRPITKEDTMANKPEILADYTCLPETEYPLD